MSTRPTPRPATTATRGKVPLTGRENSNPNRRKPTTSSVPVKPARTTTSRTGTTATSARPGTAATSARPSAPATRGPRGPTSVVETIDAEEMKKRVQYMESSITALASQLGSLSVKLAQKEPVASPPPLPSSSLERVETPAESPLVETTSVLEAANEGEAPKADNVEAATESNPTEDVSAPITPELSFIPFQFVPLPVEELEEESSSSEEEEEEEPEVDFSPFMNEIATHNEKIKELQCKKAQAEITRKFEVESFNGKHQLLQTQLESAQSALQQLRAVIAQYQLTSMKNEAEKQRLQIDIQNTINRISAEIQEVKDKFTKEKRKTEADFRAQIDDVTATTKATAKVNKGLAKEIAELREISRKHQETIDGLQAKANDAEAVRRRLCNDIQDLKGNIRVLCSVRPQQEGDETVNFEYAEDAPELSFSASGQMHYFKFDAVIPPSQPMDTLFEEISPLVESAITGCNCTLLVYGQSGSGKTHCTEGKEGIIPRLSEQFFALTRSMEDYSEVEISVHFFEIVNEQINDLLSSQRELQIKHEPNGTTTILKATKTVLGAPQEIEDILEKVKITREARQSKNAHSICQFRFVASNSKSAIKSTFNVVELVSSETKSDKSLTNLTQVITALANNAKTIPYQEAQLTNLLQHSLGGESKTVMSIHISPLSIDVKNTISTLQFALKIGACEIGVARKTTKVKL